MTLYNSGTGTCFESRLSFTFLVINSNILLIEIRNLGTGTLYYGKTQCQALGGHLPIVTTNIVSTFLANKFGGQIWLSLRTSRLKKSFTWNCTDIHFILYSSYLKLRSFTNSHWMTLLWMWHFQQHEQCMHWTGVCDKQQVVLDWKQWKNQSTDGNWSGSSQGNDLVIRCKDLHQHDTGDNGSFTAVIHESLVVLHILSEKW